MKLTRYKLGEILNVTRGASLSGEFYATEGEYIRLTCGNFDYQNNCFKENKSKDNLYYVGDFRSEFLMEEGDIITPLTEQAIGLLGSTAIIPESGKYIQSQDVAKIVCKEDLLDKNFAFYLISSALVKQQLSAAAQQTKIRHTSPDKIKDCTVWIPELSEQKRIGKLLRSIDSKIELNRQINQNLEAMAKQLYDYWFVQFDFPNEEGKPYKSSGGNMVWNEKLKRNIPIGWNNGTLIDIANITMGQSPDGTSYNEIGEGVLFYQGSTDFGMRFPSVRQYTTAPSRFAKKGDILMSVRAPVGAVNIANNDCCIGRGLSALNSKIGSTTHLYYILNDLRIAFDQRNAAGTTFGSITKEDLYNLPIVIPAKEVISAFDKICSPMFDRQMLLGEEIDTLIKQRDELLPLLLNGQVLVNSDLAVSYIIYKDVNIRIMKENIIQAIVAKMQRDLDCRQMAQLKAVLTSELHNVEIIEKEECVYQQTQENEQFLNSFISAKKIEGCSDKTLAYYRNTIERLLVTLSMAICHITTSDIRTYLSDYQEEHQSSKVTIDNMRRIFSSFFAWLEDEDYIAKSPVRRIHKVKTDSLVKEVLSDEQLEQLRDSCTNKRDLAIIDFLSSTGIRVGELVKLNREDIDFHERQCVVFGKGNKERVVYFNARTKLHLQQYLNGRTDDNPALFVSLHSPHTRLTISGVEVRIRKLGHTLSMPKVHPHKFRRTLATMAIDKGMPIEQVQRLLGHVRIDTTLHYAIVNQNNVKLAHKKYLG